MDGKIQISQNEGRVILQTDFGMQVTYDEDWAVMVAIPSSYFGATCGLCGNFNEDAEDEMKLADGTQAASMEDWAESWRDPSCQDDCGGQGTLQDTEGCGELGWGAFQSIFGEKKGGSMHGSGAGCLGIAAQVTKLMLVGINLANISSTGEGLCWSFHAKPPQNLSYLTSDVHNMQNNVFFKSCLHGVSWGPQIACRHQLRQPPVQEPNVPLSQETAHLILF